MTEKNGKKNCYPGASPYLQDAAAAAAAAAASAGAAASAAAAAAGVPQDIESSPDAR